MPSRFSRAPTPVSVSRSAVPCSSTPARTRSSVYFRLRDSIATESIPCRWRRCESISPAGPAPTIPICVRISLSFWDLADGGIARPVPEQEEGYLFYIHLAKPEDQTRMLPRLPCCPAVLGGG